MEQNISFFWALFPILVLIGLLGTNVYLYDDFLEESKIN